jgi:hypothetical protein
MDETEMNRRNFFKGLCALAIAPLTLRAKPSRDEAARQLAEDAAYTAKLSQSNIENLSATDITWARRLRMLEARMVGHNVQPFPDGLYRGNIGIAAARSLWENNTPGSRYSSNLEELSLTEGSEFEFGGFRLCVKDDDFLGVQAWGRP